jgi:nucleoside-diphosphate-sugar epimerase
MPMMMHVRSDDAIIRKLHSLLVDPIRQVATTSEEDRDSEMFSIRYTRLIMALMISMSLPRLARGFGLIGNVKQSRSQSLRMASSSANSLKKGKLLVLGGTGFVGQTICKRASLDGYSVTSLSRRGKPPPDKESSSIGNVDYRTGDARQKETIANILKEGGYDGVVHCIGLLFDDASGLGSYNRFVSGSGSTPDKNSTYDAITRLSASNAIDATMEYAKKKPGKPFPFVFVSCAEAGWPEVPTFGLPVEKYLAPDFLKRYLLAKRAVEKKLMEESQPTLRPVIVRPSLIYTLERPLSYPAVGAFFVGNKLGIPILDRPVTVQALSNAIVRAISRENVKGVQRYMDIDKLNE